jgi:hypothetical protein
MFVIRSQSLIDGCCRDTEAVALGNLAVISNTAKDIESVYSYGIAGCVVGIVFFSVAVIA